MEDFTPMLRIEPDFGNASAPKTSNKHDVMPDHELPQDGLHLNCRKPEAGWKIASTSFLSLGVVALTHKG